MASICIRETKALCLLFTLLSFGACPPEASAAVINFDDAADGTIINTRYPGVTFSNPTGGNIYARSGSGSAPSAPNVVSVFGTGLPPFDSRYGGVQARFATPVGVVSIDARPVGPLEFLEPLTKRPFLQAFDAANNFLGIVYYSGPLPTTCCFAVGPTETLTINSTLNNIAYVQFSSQNPTNPPPPRPATYGLFDNLYFASLYTLAANGAGGGSVSASPSQPSYVDGTVVTLMAAAQPGWKFSNWSGDASGTDNPLQVTMSANKLIVANFLPALPTPEAEVCVNFNRGLPAGMRLFGDAQLGAGRLKLYTVGQANGFGVAYIDDFNGGAPVAGFRATFKAALFGSTCCVGGLFPADGFSFNLVPAATVLANPGYSQPGEEGLDQGLAVNFDTWDNGDFEAPAIEVKWLGQIIASAPFQSSQSPSGITDPVAASRDVVINLDPDGTINVSYGGSNVLSNVQTPYRASKIGAPKWVFGARVGDANDNYWIDDLCIQTVAGGRLCNDFDNGVPSGATLFGNAQVDAGRLKLYTIPQAGGFGIAYFDDFSGGQFVKAFRATFKAALFGSTCCGGGAMPADGFSFNLVPAATVLPNPGYGQPGEEGLEQGLAVNFDTWDNSDGEVAPAIEVKWQGQVIAAALFQSSQSPAGSADYATAARDVVIELKADGKLDVSYGGTLWLNNVQTPYDPAAIRTPKWILGARIGGANDNFWFDDLCITTLPAPGRQIPGLYNTGVDAAGKPLADDAVDPHYRLTFGGTTAYVATEAGGFPIPPWLGSNSMSAWISPSPDTLGLSDGLGTYNYSYRTSFLLTGMDLSTARIAGRWATDNNGVDIRINTASTGQSNPNQFASWTPFVITSGFVNGVNTLDFVVNNGGPGSPPGSDPTGLRVELWGSGLFNCALAGSIGSGPALTIARQPGNTIRITWPEFGFVLQGARDATGPWHDLTRGTSINGRDHAAILPATGAHRFFRLRLDCE